jgi:hypothetical protein
MRSDTLASKGWPRQTSNSLKRNYIRKPSNNHRSSIGGVSDDPWRELPDPKDLFGEFVQIKSTWQRDNEALEANVIARLEQLEEGFSDQIEQLRHEVQQLIPTNTFCDDSDLDEDEILLGADYVTLEELSSSIPDLPVSGAHWQRVFNQISSTDLNLDNSLVEYAIEGLRNKDEARLRAAAAAAAALSKSVSPNNNVLSALEDAISTEADRHVAAIMRGTLF